MSTEEQRAYYITKRVPLDAPKNYQAAEDEHHAIGDSVLISGAVGTIFGVWPLLNACNARFEKPPAGHWIKKGDMLPCKLPEKYRQ